MDPRERFTATVSNYARYRPDYPAAALSWLRAEAPGSRAVELGSGTGIFARQLADAGFDVLGIEPNAAMRAEAAQESGSAGNPVYRVGTAEDTGLAAGSADLVVAAQAFHWFDLPRALAEIDRLLVPGGLAAAVWNTRDEEGFGADYEALLRAWSPDYRDVAKPQPTLEALRAARPGGLERRFPHEQRFDLEGALGRAWSSSYVQHGVSDREGFDRVLGEIFARHAQDGQVRLSYTTLLYAWRAPTDASAGT